MKKISIALSVYNEERCLQQCLDSVKEMTDEIVIVDGGSTDKTLEIARSFTSNIIQTDNPPMFHINKQKAISACTCEWILQLDADEVVTQALKAEIVKKISNSDQSVNGYNIPRRNIFWGHEMKKTGVYPDYVIRLFKNGKGSFPCKSVHEQILIDGQVDYLKEPLIHHSYQTFKDYWKKANAYTSLAAQDLKEKKVKKTVVSAFFHGVVYPTKTFLTLYIRNQGFVDGIYGFLFSFFSSLHHPIAFWKYCRFS
jgi:glycosyltransferase involved in cell wall biosynthesis